MLAADHVHVQVKDCLSAVGASVDDGAVSARGDLVDFGDFAGDAE